MWNERASRHYTPKYLIITCDNITKKKVVGSCKNIYSLLNCNKSCDYREVYLYPYLKFGYNIFYLLIPKDKNKNFGGTR